MDQQTLLSLTFTVGAGALSGGLTNAIAIWMLFHPYEEFRFGPIRLQGAISKNKARLARSIGKTVGERLLTPEDLAERLAAPAIREAYADAVGRVIDGLLTREHGPLSEKLSGPAADTFSSVLDGLGPRVAARLAMYTDTPEFSAQAERWLGQLKEELDSQQVGSLFTPARRDAIRSQVDDWITDLAEGDDLEQTLRTWVGHQLARLEEDRQPLGDRLPEGVLMPVEQAITDYLPVALERLSAILADPDTKSAVKNALRQAFDGAAREMLLHERLLAKLVVNDRTFERLVEGFAGRGVERLAEAIRLPTIQRQLSAAVRGTLMGLLRMPLGERLERLTPDKKEALAATAGDWLVAASRSPGARAALHRALDHGLERASDLTWGRVLAAVPPDQAVEAIKEGIASDRGREWLASIISRAARDVVSRPIGRPADWIDETTAARLRDGVVEASWGWLRTQIPDVVERLRVPEMVEQKVLGFSTQRMEEIIRKVTDKELKLIVRLGYVLGGIVGLMAFGINRLF